VDGSSFALAEERSPLRGLVVVLVASFSVACGKGGLPCASSVAAYCASTPDAVCNWSLYTEPGFVCPDTRLNDSCDPPYNAAFQPAYRTNLVLMSYYDRTTGELVAVFSQITLGPSGGASSLSCVAGPGSFSSPTCPGNSTVATCFDGGVL